MNHPDFTSPVFIALIVLWIMTVVLHEFAHGLMAMWGGDYTIRERGGLSLNPLRYVDPMMSIVLPTVFLLMGGIPLPGGSTFVRRDLIRSKGWNTAVSLAGPAMNGLIFLACAVALHPKLGWADYGSIGEWTNAQRLVAGLLVLQGVSVLLNLIPVPPLDGYQAVAPYLPRELRGRVERPPMSTYLFLGYFALILVVPGFFAALLAGVTGALGAMGYDPFQGRVILYAFSKALFGG